MKNYKKIIKDKSKETVREACIRMVAQQSLLKAIFGTIKPLRRTAQNSVLLELEDEPDQIVATYNGRIIFRAPGSDLFHSVIKEIKRRMARKEIDPESKVYTQMPKGELIDTTHELKQT